MTTNAYDARTMANEYNKANTTDIDSVLEAIELNASSGKYMLVWLGPLNDDQIYKLKEVHNFNVTFDNPKFGTPSYTISW